MDCSGFSAPPDRRFCAFRQMVTDRKKDSRREGLINYFGTIVNLGQGGQQNQIFNSGDPDSRTFENMVIFEIN